MSATSIQAVYVFSLPVGPIWFLHGFYLAASALMLGLHLRHIDPDPGAPPSPLRLSAFQRGENLIQKEAAMTATTTDQITSEQL